MTPPNDARTVLERCVPENWDADDRCWWAWTGMPIRERWTITAEDVLDALRQQTARAEALEELVREYDGQAAKHIAEVNHLALGSHPDDFFTKE